MMQMALLDGLFTVLGQEEKKIRTNPAAQVTPLLRQYTQGQTIAYTTFLCEVVLGLTD
jgi:hypothetical protein